MAACCFDYYLLDDVLGRDLFLKIFDCLKRLKILPNELLFSSGIGNLERHDDGLCIFSFAFDNGKALSMLAVNLRTLSMTRMCMKEDVSELFHLIAMVEKRRDTLKNIRKLEKEFGEQPIRRIE